MAEKKYRVFISSAREELEPERLALFALITTDPFLKEYFETVLFEKLPPPSRPIEKPYLKELDKCQIYVLMLDREYGSLAGKYSATHHEYNLAYKKDMPSLAMIKGRHDAGREPSIRAFIDQIKANKFTYKRFIDRIDLKKAVSAWLAQVLKEERDIVPAAGVAESGQETIEAASTFEALQQDEVTLGDLDIEASRSLFASLRGASAKSLPITKLAPVLRVRGLVWRNGESVDLYPTAGGVVFLGHDPAMRFPQCQVLADAYRDIKSPRSPLHKENTVVRFPGSSKTFSLSCMTIRRIQRASWGLTT